VVAQKGSKGSFMNNYLCLCGEVRSPPGAAGIPGQGARLPAGGREALQVDKGAVQNI